MLNKRPNPRRRGRLLVELRLLQDAAKSAFAPAQCADLLQDLDDVFCVCEGQLTNAEGVHVMDRIFRTSLPALLGR